jgi:hypothetical protein
LLVLNSIDSIPKFVRRSCPNVERRWFFIIFSLLKLRSQEATVTGRVRKILRTISMFGYLSFIELEFITLIRSNRDGVFKPENNDNAWCLKHY